MKYEVKLISISPYSQSRPVSSPRKDRETADDHEERTWKERAHAATEQEAKEVGAVVGQLFIPPMALKNSLAEAAKYMGKQIPGKGKSTYTKHIEAGVLACVPNPMFTDERMKVPLMADNPAHLVGHRLFVPSDGVRGSGKRVWKTFPTIFTWVCRATFEIYDDIVTERVLREHLDVSGKLIGIGRFRPRNNGYYGRFKVAAMKAIEE